MKKNAVLSVNIAVLLFGLAGLFAKWISLPALGITFGRVLLSSVSLAVFMLVTKQSFRIARKRDLLLLACAGMILAFHWWAFLESIQLSTVAIGTITFSAFPLFVTFLEPLVFRRTLRAKNIGLAFMILIGVIITVPEFSFENRMAKGIAVGMASSFAYAILTIMNKGFSEKYSATKTAFYEQATASILLLPLVLMQGCHASPSDLGMLIFLGVITTALAHTLFISSLKQLPAQLAGICSSLETVYGILFAYLLLHEVPSVRECIGAMIILSVVLCAQISSQDG